MKSEVIEVEGKRKASEDSYESYVRVRDLILNPSLDRRLFRDEAEFASYFDLGSGSGSVVERLLAEGFLEKLSSRIVVCRFETVTWTRCIRLRINLDSLSSQLAFPQLCESELDQIEGAGVIFSKGPRLVDSRKQIFMMMSVLHQAARRPLFALITQDLHRQMNPYAYFDQDQVLFDNLVPLFLNFSNFLRAGKVEKLCREISGVYEENCRILAARLTRFRRFRSDSAA